MLLQGGIYLGRELFFEDRGLVRRVALCFIKSLDKAFLIDINQLAKQCGVDFFYFAGRDK